MTLYAVDRNELASEVVGSSGGDLVHLSPVSGLNSRVLQSMVDEMVDLIGERVSGFQEEGVDLPFASILNITGSGASASYNAQEDRIDVNIPGLLTDVAFVEGINYNGVEQPDARRLNLLGDWDIEHDMENNVLNVEYQLPDIPDATLPADADVMGKSFLSVDPVDPAIPIALGANDAAVTNFRVPVDGSVTPAKAAANVVFIERCTSITRPVGRERGWVIEETDTVGMPLLKQMSADPALPDYQPIGRIGDLPIADNGEKNAAKIPSAADSRLENERAPINESVTLPKAAPEISLCYICTSTDRPDIPKHLQLIAETDTGLFMKNLGTPAEPNWQPVGSGAASVIFQEEGVTIAQRSTINAIGDGITIEDDAVNSKTLFKVPGLRIQAAGVDVATRAILNVIGGTLAHDAVNKRVNLTIPSASSNPALEELLTGLDVTWTSPVTNGNQLSFSSGAAYIPGLGAALNVPTAITGPTMTFAASTWYYFYLYSNSGTPAIEISTTAPATAYKGNSRTKTGDTSRRYIGARRTDAAGTPAMYRWSTFPGNLIHYEGDTDASPFRLVALGNAVGNTNLGTNNMIPPHARTAHMRLAARQYQVWVGTPGINLDTHSIDVSATSAITNAYVTPLLLDSSRQLFYRGSAAYIDVLGFYDYR